MNMKKLNIYLILAGLFLVAMMIFYACSPAEEPKSSEAEASARLKASEAERARELEEMNTTTVYIESSEYITEATTEITTVYIEPETPEYLEEEIKEHIIHTEAETEEEVVSSNPYGFTDDEIWEIARITYLENGCEGYYYPTYLTACVIINRYLDWDYDSIKDVIFAEGQYSTAYKYTNWSGGELVISEMTWQAVYDAMENLDRNPHYQMRGGSGNLYYQHPETGECFYY